MVVKTTVVEVNVPLCPRLRAMTKQDTVVAAPSITKMATNFSSLKPKETV